MSHPSALRGDWGVVDQRGLDVLAYWRQHAVGADFVAVDGSSATTSGQRAPNEYLASAKFEAITRWVGQQVGLPVWWAEWYVLPADADGVLGPQKSASVLAEGLIHMIAGGSAAALGWQPEGGGGCNACLWTATTSPGGGQASPWLMARGRLLQAFPAGTPLFEARASTADVAVLASRSTVAIVNRTARPLRVRVGSQVVSVGPYAVVTVPNR
jgi:hypothetical protein